MKKGVLLVLFLSFVFSCGCSIVSDKQTGESGLSTVTKKKEESTNEVEQLAHGDKNFYDSEMEPSRQRRRFCPWARTCHFPR